MPRDRGRSSSFKDDGPTQPDDGPTVIDAPASSSATPTTPLDLTDLETPKQGVDLDGMWQIYESGMRAWGKLSVTGAPSSEIETEIVQGVARLGAYLRAPDAASALDEQRAGAAAVRVKQAVVRFDTWLARRR
jgi:hypothetical protein